MSSNRPLVISDSLRPELRRRIEEINADPSATLSLEEMWRRVDELRDQHNVERLKKKLESSIEQADRGEAKPLDLDAVLDRVHRRVADESNWFDSPPHNEDGAGGRE